LLRDCGLTLKKSTATPLPLNCKLLLDEGDFLLDPTVCRTLVGKFNFLTNIRPDLNFSAQYLSQFLQNTRTSHLQALSHTLSYIQGTTTQGNLLKGSDHLSLQAFSDSNWAACPTSRRLVISYLILLGSSPISWPKSKKQGTISRSSSEAEYRTMAQAALEVTWLVRLLEELDINNLTLVTLNCNNQSTLHIARNTVFQLEDKTYRNRLSLHQGKST